MISSTDRPTGTCIVRVLGSTWDEKPSLLEAFRFADRMVNSIYIHKAAPIWADVLDIHGHVARLHSDL